MDCVRSITFVIPGTNGAPDVQVSVIEQAGSLVFTVDVLDDATVTADLRGLFFDLNDPSKLPGLMLSANDGNVTELASGNDKISDLGNGSNMKGAVKTGFDVGLEFGTQGIGKDDIQSSTFTLTNAANDLTLDDIANTLFGARLTSIGSPTGARDGSSKQTVTAPAAPDAVDDAYAIFEDGQDGLDDPSTVPEGVLFQVLDNDTDADGDTLTITEVFGALHGTVEIVDGDDADSLVGDAVLYTPFEDYAGDDAFTYCITDNNGGTDFADVDVAIEAVADVPELTYEILPGDAVNEIRLVVTATQTDADSSEFMDRILLGVQGGAPPGVTIAPGSVNPGTEPDQIVQEFLITVPMDQDVSFNLDIAAWAKETSNGDEQVATTSVLIETNHTLTNIDATFTAENQSIWDSGDQFVFTDDRFFGIDESWDESGGGFIFGSTSGNIKAGFQSTLTFEGGEIDAQLDYDLSFETLYNKTTDVLFLTADSLLSDASFTTEGPEGSYQLDFLFDFFLTASAGLDFGDLGSWDIFSTTLGPVNEEFNILDLNSDNLGFELPLPAGFSIDFAWPNLDTTSDPLAGNTVASDGASNNFLQLNLDVDDFVFALLGLPNPFSLGFDIEVASGSIDLLDLDLSLGLNFLQDFLMTVNSLEGTITFEDNASQAFDFTNDITVMNASIHDANNDGSIAYTIELTPDADLLNDTNLGFNFGYQFDVLKLTGSYDIVVDSGSLNLGPLFSIGDTIPLGSVDLYENEFDVAFASEDWLLAA